MSKRGKGVTDGLKVAPQGNYDSLVPYLAYRLPSAADDGLSQKSSTKNMYSARYGGSAATLYDPAASTSTFQPDPNARLKDSELSQSLHLTHGDLSATGSAHPLGASQLPSHADLSATESAQIDLSLAESSNTLGMSLAETTIHEDSDLAESGVASSVFREEIIAKKREIESRKAEREKEKENRLKGRSRGATQHAASGAQAKAPKEKRGFRKWLASILQRGDGSIEEIRLPEPNAVEQQSMEDFEAFLSPHEPIQSSDALDFAIPSQDSAYWKTPQTPVVQKPPSTPVSQKPRVRFDPSHGVDETMPIAVQSFRLDSPRIALPSADADVERESRGDVTGEKQNADDEENSLAHQPRFQASVVEGETMSDVLEKDIPVVTIRALRSMAAEQNDVDAAAAAFPVDADDLPQPPQTDQKWWAALRGKTSRGPESGKEDDSSSISSYISIQQESFYEEIVNSSKLTTEFQNKTSPIDLISDKHIQILAKRLETGLDPKYVDPTFKKSLLRKAIEKGQENVFKLLLSYGAYVPEVCEEGFHLIHYAAQQGNCNIIQILVDCGEDTRMKANICQSTPLHIASKNGRSNAVDLLIHLGVNINALDVFDNTPLHCCAKSGNYPRHVKCATILLDNGARLNAQNSDGSTPLHLASKEGYAEMVRLFVKRPDVVLITDDRGLDAFQIAKTNGRISVIEEFENAIKGPPFLKLPSTKRIPRIRFFMSSYTFSIASETNCQRMHHLLETKQVEYELINLAMDVTQLHEMKRISGTMDLPQLILDETYVGDMDVVQMLEDDGLLDCLFAGDIRPESVKQWTQNEWAPIFICAKNNLPDIAHTLSVRGVPIDIQTQDTGDFPIHVAASNGHRRIIDYLLEHGANLEAVNYAGHTPLYLACVNGHVRLFRYLLRRGANYQVLLSHPLPALHLAAEKGHREICKLLLDNGFKTMANRVSQSSGMDALHHATKGDSVDVVSLLLEYECDVTTLCKKGYSPLHYAIEKGSIDIVNILLEHEETLVKKDESYFGTKPPLTRHGVITPIVLAAKHNRIGMIPVIIRHFGLDEKDSSCLIEAASRGHAQVCRLILATYPELAQMPDPKSRVALHYAAYYGKEEIIDVLFKAGASPNPPPDHSNNTPLHLASRQGHHNVVELLLNHGSDATIPNSKGRMALHEACLRPHLSVLQKFVKYAMTNRVGLDDLGINRPDNYGATPLHLATVKAQRLEGYKCVELLLVIGAPPEIPDKFGNTCYHLAADMGLRQTIEILLKVQMTPNVTDLEGNTPLHLASKSGREPVVRLLLTCPGLEFSENKAGKTALQLATENGHNRVSTIISFATKDSRYRKELLAEIERQEKEEKAAKDSSDQPAAITTENAGENMPSLEEAGDNIDATLEVIRKRNEMIMQKWSSSVVNTRVSSRTGSSRSYMRRGKR